MWLDGWHRIGVPRSGMAEFAIGINRQKTDPILISSSPGEAKASAVPML